MGTQYGDEDVFYVELTHYTRWNDYTAYEPHTRTRVEAETREEALDEMRKRLAEWDLDRPEPDAPVRSIEEVRVSRKG